MTNPPKTWLTESILVTLLCCLPIGIVAIIQANKVSSLIAADDEKGAIKASENAKMYVIVSAVLGVVLIGLFLFGTF
ncbi:MAG: CD225/dispanin family protein [Candidatus Nanoarchaeia archaeon]|jgi:hypothetical protein|nr:CD225/dispanin family protein [Candidatus Nanoarchaeia archaeon]